MLHFSGRQAVAAGGKLFICFAASVGYLFLKVMVFENDSESVD